MAPGPRGTRRAAPRPRHGFSLPASRSIVSGRHREGTALLPAAESPEWVSPSPIVPAILLAIAAPCSTPSLPNGRISAVSETNQLNQKQQIYFLLRSKT